MKKIEKTRLLALNASEVMVLKKVGSPLRYTLPGGVKKKKETALQTLIRETSEEIDLQLFEEQIHPHISIIKKNKHDFVYKIYFYAYVSRTKINVLEQHKFEKAIWLHWQKAIKSMDKADKQAVVAYFENFSERENNNFSTNGSKISSRIAM